MRSDIAIHTGLSLSSMHVCPSPARRHTLVLAGLMIRFPHTSFYPPKKRPHNSLILSPPFFCQHQSTLFSTWLPSGLCECAPVSYVTSFLESLPPARWHCITCSLLNEGPFSLPFLWHKYDTPLMYPGLHLVLKGRPASSHLLLPPL